MSIIIDAITPNQECLETRPSSQQTDHCEVEAHFHLRGEEGSRVISTPVEEPMSFYREAGRSVPNYYMQASTVSPILSELIIANHFNPTDAALQRDLINIVDVRIRYERGREIIAESDPAHAPQLESLFDDLINFIFLGEIVSPDSIQLERNQSILVRLTGLPPRTREAFRMLIESFLFENRGFLQREDATALSRVEYLASILNFSRLISEGLAPRSQDLSHEDALRDIQAHLIGYLFTGQPILTNLTSRLSSLAREIFSADPGSSSERRNLYRILLPVLQRMQEQPPFNTAGDHRLRLGRLMRWLEQPSQSRALEYSLMEPDEALVHSVVDSLQESPQTEALLDSVEDEIDAPDLDADWLQENGHLREIVEAIFSSVSVHSADARQFELRVDSAHLRSGLNDLFQHYLVDNREYIGGALAVLRFLTRSDSVRVYWEGEVRGIRWSLSPEDRSRLQAIDRWMASRIQRSLTETDVVLPIIEAGVCAAGIGLTLWSGLDDSLSGDTMLGLQIGGGGTTGLGCGALATHFIFDTGNHWISDLIGGGVGTVLGIGIPLFLHFLGAGGTPPVGPGMDGRNPITEWGP